MAQFPLSVALTFDRMTCNITTAINVLHLPRSPLTHLELTPISVPHSATDTWKPGRGLQRVEGKGGSRVDVHYEGVVCSGWKAKVEVALPSTAKAWSGVIVKDV